MQEKLNITNAVINGEEQPTVNARELWTKLESKQDFSTWIKNRLADFEEGVDFTVHKIVDGKNKGRFAAIEYTLTLDTAKHLCMLERNEQGKKIRQYFIEFEKGARKVIEDMVKDYEENINFCRNMYADTCAVIAPTPKDLKSSTIELLDMLNRKILAGEEVNPDVLKYAWNVGKLFYKALNTQTNDTIDDEFANFVNSIPAGEYRRGDIYDMYCARFARPLSSRWLWPRVRRCRHCQEYRSAFDRYVIFVDDCEGEIISVPAVPAVQRGRRMRRSSK